MLSSRRFIFLQVVFTVASQGTAYVSQQCDKDASAYLQKPVKVHSSLRQDEKVVEGVADLFDPCLADINRGECDSSCDFCVSNNAQIPSDAESFPNGYLKCSGDGACQLNRSVANWDSDFYRFKDSGDYLECVGQEACRYWLAENLGATCCSGSDSCRNSQLALNEATASCSNDACCAGKNSCVKATLTGIDSLSCRGEGACWDASAVLTGNLYCDSSGTIGGACSSSEAAFTFKGGQHCLECYGERTCAFQSEFIFMPGSGSFRGNVSMKCGSSASSTETCAEAQVQLLEGTCLHLHCAKNTCQNLAVIINAGDSSKCYCEGEGCANVISSGVGILPCENVTENDPTPCGADICSGSRACCDALETPDCGACCTTPAAPEPTTAAPEPTTAAPAADTTAAPEPTTAAPEVTTAAAESTTAAPEVRRAAAELTTAAPEVRRAAAESTTAAPEVRRAAAELTTAAPEVRRVAAESTTAAPATVADTSTSTAKPVSDHRRHHSGRHRYRRWRKRWRGKGINLTNSSDNETSDWHG